MGWMEPGALAKSMNRRVVSLSLHARPAPPSFHAEIWAEAGCAISTSANNNTRPNEDCFRAIENLSIRNA